MEMRITATDAGKTILTLTRRDLGFSSALLKKLKFKAGGILVNGQFATVRYVLAEGDLLTLTMDDTEADVSPYIVPTPREIPILYEDADITVVNKPSNMPAHPSLGHKWDTVANALAYHFSDRPYVFRPVNRLDRDTSGVMLTANTKLSAYRMARAMQAGEIRKTYVAVVYGHLPEKEGVIDSSIRRVPDSIMLRENCAPTDAGARAAETRYRVLAEGEGCSLVAAYPITGRTHQIRVHFTGVGCPLLGDDLYGEASPQIARHALHGAVTVFPHPKTGESVVVRAPLPEDMEKLIRERFASCAATILADLEKLC